MARGRKKIHTDGLKPISVRLPTALWDRFKRYAENHVPRTTDTAILAAAITEYLDRHEPKKKKQPSE